MDATVLDFWRWAFSDRRDNTVRGMLAEFLVAAALGRTETRRKGWDNFDVRTDSGIRVEVKASATSRAGRKPSTRAWTSAASRLAPGMRTPNEFGTEPEVRADVFVFAVQTCKDPAL